MRNRVLSLPRLARNSIVSLLDLKARVFVSLDDPRIRSGEIVWQRRQVRVAGHLGSDRAEIGFQDRASDIVVSGRIDAQLPRPERACGLAVRFSNGEVLHSHAPSLFVEVTTRLSAVPAVLAEFWKSRSSIRHFLSSGDQTVAATLRRRFGLTPETDQATAIPDTLFSAQHFQESPPTTLIIPVYNAAEDVSLLLAVLPARLPANTNVVVVEDGSSDPRIEPVIAKFAKVVPGTKVIRFKKNQGFVEAVNRGFAAARPEDHIVILNTDTVPPPDWMPRLLAPILESPEKVATVTPFSNTAEILSVPAPDHVTELDDQCVIAIDRVASKLRQASAQLPTGIGFCMAMNRTFLNRIGSFDPAFGRGYGEEVDWCQRAIAAGGHHVTAPLFVGHKGGASFGAEKTAKIRHASAVIAERYPDYDHAVHRWIANAPLAPEILALSIGWLAATCSEVSIFLGHSFGGGAEQALQAEIAGVLTECATGVLVLRVGGSRMWRVELHLPSRVLAGDVADDALVHRLFAPVRSRRIIYSCGVGAADPFAVPNMIENLCRANSSLELRLHDFFPISPSWNLLNADGQYRGIPSVDTLDTAHRPGGASGSDHAQWRHQWGQIAARSDVITAFAPSGYDLFCGAYPSVAEKVVCKPHVLPQKMPCQIAPGGKSIGVLGGINLAKGAKVIEALSKRQTRRIIVIGEMDGQFRLAKPHLVHGRYQREKINHLAETYDIGLWLIPSICPETFSFATHEALATGLPVIGFDLGAQSDALQNAPNGHVIDTEPDDIDSLDAAIEGFFLQN